MVKNGSLIPTASGDSDPCDCKAGYKLEYDGLSCVECPAGTTSAGGRVTECTAVPNSDARASGGIIVTVGDYVIHTFTDSGYFAATDSTLTEVDVLVVGVGGGGAGGQGNLYGGGGGGGEVVYTANKAINFMTYYVAVGFGGAPNRGTGDASSFAGITANPGSWPTATTGGKPFVFGIGPRWIAVRHTHQGRYGPSYGRG